MRFEEKTASAGKEHPIRTQGLFRAKQVVWYLLGALEILLAFRFFMKLAMANPSASFTQFVYDFSQPFVKPFMTVFRITRVEGSVFEWATLLAMLVYWVAAMGILQLIMIGKPVTPEEADEKIDQE